MAIQGQSLKKLLVLSNSLTKALAQYHSLAMKYSLTTNLRVMPRICPAPSCMSRPLSLSSSKSSGREATPFLPHKGSHGYFDFKELESNASVESRKNHFLVLMYETFYLSEEEAHEVMDAHPFLWKEFFHKTFSFLKAIGLEKTTFLRYPWLVAIPPEELETKLEIIEHRFNDMANINVGATLLKLSAPKLGVLTKLWESEAVGTGFPSKFHYFAHIFEVPLSEAMYLAEPKPFLFTFPFARLKESITICLDGGISKEDLMKDLWVVRNRPAKIKNRIEILQQVKVPIKPWVLRTTLSSFETHIKEYWQTRIDMQDHADIPSYLAARLKCDVSQVELMMNNFPGVKKVSVSKLKRTLDYLLIERNIDPNMIISTPRILCQKLETVKTRLERLEALGVTYGTLWVVCSKENVFQDFTVRWGPKQ